jgi:hypothetical protein
MERSSGQQYTIRGVPASVAATLRERARREGKSLNRVAVEALSRGLGLSDGKTVYHDLDDLVGTWVDDPQFDAVIEAMNRVDPELWK